jgi:serine/threonine protein kinase
MAESNFLQRLRESELLDAQPLETACAEAGDEEPHLSRYLISRGLLTRFQVRELYKGNRRFQVDKYVVVDFIGRGGHSQVFKARHKLLPHRYVALKSYDLCNLHQQEDVLARFRHEVDIVFRLDHRNIVRAYDVVQTRRQLFLVMEYVAGCDLAGLVNEFGPLPIADAVGYVIQAAYGLAYAHRCGIVHRDIKPANLLLARDGAVKLADLGLAQALAADRSSGKGEPCGGTPEFMAPEQARSGPIDCRSDLYSLGSTFFHLLTGELPVNGGSYFHCLKQLLTQPPRPLAEARPGAPAELAAVVDGMRASDPDQRPANAEEVIERLEPFGRPRPPENDPQRWAGSGKASLILDLLRGRFSPEEICREYGLEAAELERWRRRFLEGAAQALEPAPIEAEPAPDALQALYAKIGAQAVEIEALKGRAGN